MLKESRYNIWVDIDSKSYVFNGVSGSILCLPKELRENLMLFLYKDSTYNCNPELLLNMVYGRMLIPDDKDEITLLKRRYKASRDDDTHLVLTILPTLSCNFNCLYCYEDKRSLSMTKDVELAILDFLEDRLAKITAFFVSWFGGEPLLSKKQLFDLSDAFISQCDHHGTEYSSSITTNGYLLDELTCVLLRDYGVHDAQITLDGPPTIHNRMRPLLKGGDTFWRIIENIHHAIDYMNVIVRVNLDKSNFNHADELMQILVDEDLSGKITVSPGQIIVTNVASGHYSRTQENCSLTCADFSNIEHNFNLLAVKYGFSGPLISRPKGTPCTAPRVNEYVVGPSGELYKCWRSVGDFREIVGTIWDIQKTNTNLKKWLRYTPFEHKDCLECLALPVCMGGCAYGAMDPLLQENKCVTFRHTYLEQITNFIRHKQRNENA